MSKFINFNPPNPLNTPVLLIVFNRLKTTKLVFQAIRQAKPPIFYVAADGARTNKVGEIEKVRAVREYIMQNIDWKCEVKTLFRKDNLGCKYAVSGAISWFFDNEEEGIILEDDCLPSKSFFWYCEELLGKYKADNSIYLISGETHNSEFLDDNEDYNFCKYPLIWGWASWRRAWKNYDPEISDWPVRKEKLLNSVSKFKSTVNFWKINFERIYKKEIDTWDYQLAYLLLVNDGKCIFPKVNLITNIGFGPEATRKFEAGSVAENRERYEINLPLNDFLNPKSEEKVNKYYDLNEFSLKNPFIHYINKKIYNFIKFILGSKKSNSLRVILKNLIY